MLFLMFFYILAAILVFQGLHLFSEISEPLGTVPEEVAQATVSSQRWGAYLMAYGGLMALCGLLSIGTPYFLSALKPLQGFALLSLGAFGAWVVFKGRTIEYMGTPAEDDHGHAHH